MSEHLPPPHTGTAAGDTVVPAGLETEVLTLVRHACDAPAAQITVQARFESLPTWTSLTALRLLTELEDRFGHRLDLREYLAVRTVGELVDLLAGRWAGSGGGTLPC